MESSSPETTCRVVRPGPAIVGKQALTYAPAVSAETVGSTGLHMQLVTLPPGARARAHLHEAHETALHVLSGVAGTWYGERLEHHLWSRAGDFVYIPAGVPHLPYNASRTETCTAVIARTDPNEQEKRGAAAGARRAAPAGGGRHGVGIIVDPPTRSRTTGTAAEGDPGSATK